MKSPQDHYARAAQFRLGRMTTSLKMAGLLTMMVILSWGDHLSIRTAQAFFLGKLPRVAPVVNKLKVPPNMVMRKERIDQSISDSAMATTNTTDLGSRTSFPTSSSSSAVDISSVDLASCTRPDFCILSRTLPSATTLSAEDGTTHGDPNRPAGVPLIYLDSAATSQKPRQVLDTLHHFYTHINANVHRGAHTLSREATSAYEAARDKVAAWIGASSRSEIVFTSGATDAINLVAQTYGRTFLTNPGDEIVLTVTEHHANLVPWQILAQENQLQLRFVDIHDDTQTLAWEDQLPTLLNERTKLVAFQHVSNVLGTINPVPEMVALIRKLAPQAVILLDACQSVPHMPVRVQELGVDFLVASGHKMCGPTGIGFLWGRADYLQRMPPWRGGGEMIEQVTLQTSTYAPPPGRFEAGTPAIAQAVGLGAAIDYLQELGMDRIEAYEQELAIYLFERLAAVPGIRILGPQVAAQRSALCAFVHESIHPSDLSAFLDIDGVAIRAGHHCCQPLHARLGYSHSARASLAFYNTKEDVDAFIRSLENTIQFFQGLTGSSSEGASELDDFKPFI